MFSPFSKTNFSAAKGQKLNTSSPYFSASIRRSLTPSCSRNSSFGRSYVNSILDESTNHTVETYGSPLPVLVTEAITVAEKITDVSVKLEPFGYASLVCGRQLFIWKYKHDGVKIIHCRELALPPSDLAHRADLVHVFLGEEGHPLLPSALAVSPEGHVRYWRNVNHEGASVDAQPDLQGQECCSLTPLQPLGCILATTSGSLVIITPTIGEGQPGVICRTLTLPMGILAGISRKVSSFIFGSIPAQTSETKQLNRVLAARADREEGSLVYVLTSSSLQEWHIAGGSDRKEVADQLLFEVELDQELKQRFSDTLNDNDSSFVPNMKTWCLDMQLCSSGVMIFTAGTLMARLGGAVHYAFGIVDPEQSSEKFTSFHVTSYSEPFQEDLEERLLHYKFLLPTTDNLSAYIYNSSKVVCIQIETPSTIHHSELDFSTTQDVILGSGSCEGVPLFFTRDYGILSVCLKQKAFENSRLLTSMKDVSFRQTDPTEPPESLFANLRAALCAFCANDTESCERLVGAVLSIDNVDVDAAVVCLSLGIIDDHPVSDPRWCESIPSGFVSSSLLISYQLEDKLKTHECLMTFLKALHLLERLTTFKDGDLRVATNILLSEHAEKLAAAKALRLFLNDHSEVIETAIRDALDRRNIEVKNHLTAQDVFFREVSAFHTVFPSLVDWEEEQMNVDENPETRLSAIITMNKIFVGLLQAAREQRLRSPNLLLGGEESLWTAREGSSGIRQHVRNQLVLNEKNALKLTDSIQVQGVLFQQYVELLDLHLSTYLPQSAFMEEFKRERRRFIEPLLSIRQYERAAAIAEKYLDFDILIQLCEETKNPDRLQRYMLQFTEQNFSQFVFKWYLNKGQRGRIFDRHLGQREVLGSFLQEHEGLRWLYFLQEEKYASAHATLWQLVLQEAEFLNRKKTLLSLSKLCAMVSDVPHATKDNQIKAINLEQDLIAHQEALPISVVESCGIDPKNMRVFPPEELIEMYISEENSTANAYDFKIALDLLGFMKKPADDPEVHSLRMSIWAKAILRDNWDILDINNPVHSVKETVFFQIIELAFDQGVDVPDFMPSIDELLQTSEMRNLVDNPSFKFLLQAGYEHILKIIA